MLTRLNPETRLSQQEIDLAEDEYESENYETDELEQEDLEQEADSPAPKGDETEGPPPETLEQPEGTQEDKVAPAVVEDDTGTEALTGPDIEPAEPKEEV